MDSFAFIIHPIDPKRDVERKYPLLGKILPVWLIDILSGYWPPVYISHITGVRSEATGKEIKLERVKEIAGIARRHGFRSGGLCSFERAIADEEIERIRENARRVSGRANPWQVPGADH